MDGHAALARSSDGAIFFGTVQNLFDLGPQLSYFPDILGP